MADENQVNDAQASSTEPDQQRELLRTVRNAAGWRVSPRHLDAALQALDAAGEPANVERIVTVVNAFHGERSQRQRRNTDLWRLLGAQLAVRGKHSGPDSQQSFIGRAKALAQEDTSDLDLLIVATALGNANHPLTPEMTADAASWLIEVLGDDFDAGSVDDRIDDAVEAAIAARADSESRKRRRR